MDSFIALGILLFVTVAFLFLVDKFKKSREATDVQKSAIGLINRFFADSYVHSELAGLEVEAALLRGQDILWEESEKFNLELAKSMTSEEPQDEQLSELVATAARIVKCASLMQTIFQTQEPLPGMINIILTDESITDESPSEG